MARRNPIFSLGTENLGSEVEIVEVPAKDPRPIETRLLEAHIGVMDADAQAVQTDLRNGLDAAAALEQLLDLVNLSLESGGGLDKAAATAVSINLQHISKTLRMSQDSMSVSLESFDVAPQQSSQVALESIREKLASIWKAIVEALQRAIAWIKTTLGRVTDVRKRLGDRVSELEKRLKKVGDWNTKDQKVVSQVLISRLSTPQCDPEDIISLYVDTTQFLLRLTSHASDGAMKSMSQIEKVMKDKPDRDNLISFQTDIMEAFAGPMERAFQGSTQKEADAPEGTTVYASPMLLGGVIVSATVPTRYSSVTKFEISKQRVESDGWSYLPMLDAKQVKLILDSIRRIEEYEKRVLPFKSAISELSNKISSLSKSFAAEEQGDENQVAQARSIREAAAALMRITTDVPAVCSSLVVSTYSNMLALAEASVDQATASKPAKK